jgi:hypothetical protein
LKSKIILTGLFLTTAISCSSFKPYVLTDAYNFPLSKTEVTYGALNFQTALFNQYASGLSYTFTLNYSQLDLINLLNSISVNLDGVNYLFQSWTTVTTSFATADLDATWTNRLNRILFDRSFNESTGKARTDNNITLISFGGTNNVNLEITIKSRVTYRVSVGAAYMSINSVKSANMDNTYVWLDMFDISDQILQRYNLLSGNTIGSVTENALWNLGAITTGVSSFNLRFQFEDTPPFVPAGNFNVMVISEFNLFTQGQEIDIPDDTSGDRFGFEFVAVEWWNILGHLQNFAWWIVNKSPIAPVFEWLDTYVLTWINGLITFITGVFNL